MKRFILGGVFVFGTLVCSEEGSDTIVDLPPRRSEPPPSSRKTYFDSNNSQTKLLPSSRVSSSSPLPERSKCKKACIWCIGGVVVQCVLSCHFFHDYCSETTRCKCCRCRPS